MAENKKIENTEKIQSGYTPLKPVDPNDYTVQQYLFDTNTLLTKINESLNLVIELLARKEQEKQETRKVRTIGISQ